MLKCTGAIEIEKDQNLSKEYLRQTSFIPLLSLLILRSHDSDLCYGCPAHYSVHLFCPQTCLVHLCNHPTGSGVHLAKSRHGFTCSSCAMIHGKCWKVYSMHSPDSMHLALQVEALAILGIVEDKARRCVFACHPWGTSSKVYMAPSGWTEQLNPTLSQ